MKEKILIITLDKNHPLMKDVLAIREKVFVEEQKVSYASEHDDENINAHYYLAFYNELPVATARWRETTKGIKVERVAVLPDYRNKGLGGMLMKKIMEEVLLLKKLIYLHSQLSACFLYSKHGFVEKGAVFLEDGIEHYLMECKG